MKRMVFAIGLTLITPATMLAQGQHAGFVVTLGNDTIAVERYTRTATSIEGDLLNRTPRTRAVHYVATLDGSRVRKLEVAIRQPPATTPGLTGTVDFGKDSATVNVRLGDSLRTFAMAVGPESGPTLNNSFALIEQSIMRRLATNRDSVPFDLVPVGPTTPTRSFVVRRGRDSVVVGYFGLPGLAEVDAGGRLLGYDGRETTVKVIVHRVPDVDIEGLLTRYAAMDAGGQSMGQLSSRDTARATFAETHVMVDYGRPMRRGRTIFGDVVPFGVVWRTGANAATQLMVDKPVAIGGVELTPGTYTLWTLPSATGAKLIINKQHGQWGTDYDVTQDLARVELITTPVAEPVERFTIAVLPEGTAGKLVLTWDRTQYSIPIVAR